MDKIAIIGTSVGQRELYVKAKSAGYYTIGFSWDKSPDILRYIDRFYNISIKEKDEIVRICREESVIGVVSNGSELTAQISSYVAEQLELPCTSYTTILNIQNKKWVRKMTQNIIGLSQINYKLYDDNCTYSFPCIVKPVIGGGKCGVSYVSCSSNLIKAIQYAQAQKEPILIEDYIDGKEVSVETISFNGNHYIIQITDKDSSGPPHFVELGHHQPSELPDESKKQINNIIPVLLNKIGFTNGATHIELKISDSGIFLIEVNPRGGGDLISNKLVELSTGYDYIFAMIQVATGRFTYEPVNKDCYSGIYFLTKQTEQMLPYFETAKQHDWYVEGEIFSNDLKVSLGNAMKNGYVIYKSNHKIEFK